MMPHHGWWRVRQVRALLALWALLCAVGAVGAAGASDPPGSRADWATIMSEGFEGAFPGAGWAVSGTFHWAARDCRVHSGSYAAWAIGGSSVGGPTCGNSYPNSLKSWMTYGPFDLSNYGAAEVEFWYWTHSEEAHDYLRILVSADGSGWASAYEASGDSSGWQQVVVDLQSWLGDPSVWIRFAFDTSLQVTDQEGAYVDDIVVRGQPMQKASLRSVGANDGWVRESRENSDAGGTFAATGPCRAGDDARDRQYRSILDFDTRILPDDAVITSATLAIKESHVVGSDPSATHGTLRAGIRDGSFNRVAALEAADFQAPANIDPIGAFSAAPGAVWLRVTLDAAARAKINLTGRTQFRVAYAVGDDDDETADYLAFYCGDALITLNRPVLRVTYVLP